MECIRELAEIYPQLYLDPGRYGIDDYKSVVLRGENPDEKELPHFVMDERDHAEIIETPAGDAKVVTLYNRHDFELFIRCMMAAKEGPDKTVPATMGASTISCFNWPRINAHKEEFMRQQLESGVESPDWPAEFSRFREVKENYTDMFIVLSRGPYSNISAEDAGGMLHRHLSDPEWLENSDSIRKYHELTHFVCRRLYPDRIDAIWDELAADAAGLFAAFGCYDSCCRRLEELFLGISEGRYTGGRIINYVDPDEDMDELAGRISAVLRDFEEGLKDADPADIFEVILRLEGMQDALWQK